MLKPLTTKKIRKANFLKKQMELQTELLKNMRFRYDFSHELKTKNERTLIEKFLPKNQTIKVIKRRMSTKGKRHTITQIYESLKLHNTGGSNNSSESNSDSSASSSNDEEKQKNSQHNLSFLSSHRVSRSIYSRSILNHLDSKMLTSNAQSLSVSNRPIDETRAKNDSPVVKPPAHKPSQFSIVNSSAPKKKKGPKQIRFKETNFILEYNYLKKVIDEPIENDECILNEEDFLDYTEAYLQIRVEKDNKRNFTI